MWSSIRLLSIDDLQPRHLSDPQARRISSRQRDAIARSRNRFQKAHDLLRAENRRKLLRLLAVDDPLERLLVAERDAIEEPQRTCDLVDMRPRPLLRYEMELVGTDLLHAEPIRWTVEMATKLRHRVDVRLLRRTRQIADRHVLDHAPAKRAHCSHLELLS